MPTPAETTALRVLLVDDDPAEVARLRGLVAELRDRLAVRVDLDPVESFEAGAEEMASGRYDAHLVASRLGARDGLDLLRAYREGGGTVPVIMISARSDRRADVAAMESGAADYLVTDQLDAAVFERSIRYAVEAWRREAVLHGARETLQERVAERTVSLETMNAALGAEVGQRRQAEHALREIDRLRNEFLATLAHELRNPLAPIQHATEILARSGGGAEDRARDAQALRVIERQLAHLVRLIDDLLDVSRIMHGKLELRRERVLLGEVVESALETSRPLFLDRRHELAVLLPETPVPIFGDAIRLAQILTNLLSNAARYTAPGGRIRVEAMADGPTVAIRVVDTGIGIPPNELAHIFTMFGQAAQPSGTQHEGLGIGLPLAKRLAELHGGTVTAASEGESRGSVFTLLLPRAPDVPAEVARAAPAPPRKAAAPRRILVVDDNVDAAFTLAELLALGGHETHVAHEGPAAVQAARRLVPDVVILDLGLPGFDGYEVARRLRSDPTLAGLLLVALSGWVREEDLARSQAAGFDRHFAKPVDVVTLERLLEESRPKARGARTLRGTASESA